ncbi:MAG: hypothetical protein V9E93_05940 [Steroidobacteraceae bacterium]|nr:hypothetical protein [Pseudomonadota bacterium]
MFGDPGLEVPTKARLVDDGDSEALRRKLESVEWKLRIPVDRDQRFRRIVTGDSDLA